MMGKPENPVGTVQIAGHSGQKHRGFLEGALLLLLILVTGALVTLGLLYAHSRGEWGRPLLPDPPPNLRKVCVPARSGRASLVQWGRRGLRWVPEAAGL